LRYIGVAAYSGPPPDHLKAAAEEFLQTLALCRSVDDTAIVTGGYWGLMKYVVDQALSLGFRVIIIPPLEMEDIQFPLDALVIRTGTSFRVRSIFLVRTSEVLVALGGAAGTMQEIVTAYTEGIPIFVLGMTGLPTDKLYGLAPYLDNRKRAEIRFFNDPKTLTQAVCKYLEETPPKGWAGL